MVGTPVAEAFEDTVAVEADARDSLNPMSSVNETTTRSVLPTSEAVTSYVVPVSPGISTVLRCHWKV